jgi:hypothetical protein
MKHKNILIKFMVLAGLVFGNAAWAEENKFFECKVTHEDRVVYSRDRSSLQEVPVCDSATGLPKTCSEITRYDFASFEKLASQYRLYKDGYGVIVYINRSDSTFRAYLGSWSDGHGPAEWVKNGTCELKVEKLKF